MTDYTTPQPDITRVEVNYRLDALMSVEDAIKFVEEMKRLGDGLEWREHMPKIDPEPRYMQFWERIRHRFTHGGKI